ncbi:unnamed protein product [Allacma fusca]|uniref:LMBR1 domain-containing protein 2 homolog n=1 Tax=Allacma fusca TaxID=39272 RepID=A0A8J2MF58_9HEXA|nr:unnamed protein product [Allacma fusca]
MSSWHLGFDLIVTFLLASVLLYNYGNWYRHHVIVTLAVLVAWYFSFIIIFVLPIDISDATFRQCNFTSSNIIPLNTTNTTSNWTTVIGDLDPVCMKPSSYVGDRVLKNLWRVVYWTSQVLTWLILPMMQSYTQAGEFRIAGKLRSALMDNVIYYGSYLFICGVLLAYIATKPVPMEWHELKVIASSASNTWGLFLLVFMLGYGLISVPKELYYRSCKSYSLNKAYFKLSKLNSERLSCEEQVDDILELVSGCAKFDTDRPKRKFQEELDAILRLIPVEMRERMGRRNVEAVDHDLKYLTTIHKKFKRSLMNYNRTEALYKIQIKDTIELEDIEKSRNLGTFQRSIDTGRGKIWTRLGPRMEWIWKCFLWKWLLFAASIIGFVLSLIVIWSEVTFFVVKPKMSIFAHFISYDYNLSETVCFIGILYLATCTFYTVFKIRVFNFYYLASGHLTDEYSLIFAGMLLCRLTPPLCLNFLGMTHMDSHIIKEQEQETSYTYIMGHMDVLKIISDGFNIYFPMGILIFQQFLADDEISIEYVNEGRDILSREKRRLQRNIDAQRRTKFDRGQQAAQEANRTVRNLETLEDTRIHSQSRAYGSPDSTSRLHYNPPRGLFDDV